MTSTPRRRQLRIRLLVAVVACSVSWAAAPTLVAADGSAPRPQVPSGYVQLVDDTGTISVVVPATWDDVDLTPIVHDDGTEQAYIAAAPDLVAFASSFDVPGVVYTALPYTADPQPVIDASGLTGGCATVETIPYSDAVFTGLVQVGTTCGASGAATWNMVVASPMTAEFTAMVQVQTATATDQAGFDMVLDTFDRADPSTATVPPAVTAPAEPSPTFATVPTPTVPAAPTAPVSTVAAVPDAGTTPPASDPQSVVPPGYQRLYDDTGTITVVVPSLWADTATYELQIDEGRPRIAAATDIAAFQSDSDAAGVLLIAEPFTADVESLVGQYSRDDSCQQSGTQPFDDAGISGLMWFATGCGPSGQGTWLVLVASPADQSMTLRLHARTATAADEPAVDMVLQTFAAVPPGAVPPATLPPADLPATAVPTEVATAFTDALAAGDGAAACSLLSPDYVANLGVSVRTCASDLAAVVTGQSLGWAAVEILGEVTVESDACSASDPAAGYAAVELVLDGEHGCMSLGSVDGAWRIEDLSNSIWNAVADH